ncbi:hypothetical protein FISHEDRAFT_33929 [Fistulina hepatica ATCC 64428]|uniref:Uncharacterized protein n=1 Tax=Fistulina hepatica ATCC 64428 TaxID=1128425 RepID=A0A0D7AN29_9AGAR|nr:hypothetical protein FISHEDRAFT_33929 [Fistulina hepatica ATCC 64428]
MHRRNFIGYSITHLFETTFSPTSDALSISNLLSYLNAAMPQDRYEDFDTTEVVRGVTAEVDRSGGCIVLEGDMIRIRSV